MSNGGGGGGSGRRGSSSSSPSSSSSRPSSLVREAVPIVVDHNRYLIGLGKQSPQQQPQLGRAERIAQLVRQHKDINIDPVTGAAQIPRRSSSIVSIVGVAEASSSGPPSRLSSPVDPAMIMSHAPPATGTLDRSPTASITGIEASSSRGGGTSGAVGGGGRAHSVRSNEHRPPPLAIMTMDENGDDARSDGYGDARSLPTPTSAATPSGGALSSGIALLGLASPTSDYRQMEATEVASRLFDLTLPGVTKDGVCQIIGKNDAFHNAVLFNYMDLHEFYGMTLDDAFRSLCKHLHLNGETQQVDRILFQFSRRYWDCNIDAQSTFLSIDIVYGILFSLVLLNTDLHIANVGPNSMRKMQRKTFVKNTQELIDKMIANDEGVRETVNALGVDGSKRWRKDMEVMLKDLYTSVKDNRILQRTEPDVEPRLARDVTSPPSGGSGLRRSNSAGKRSGFGKARSSQSPGGGLPGTPSSSGASPGGSPFFRSSTPQLGGTGSSLFDGPPIENLARGRGSMGSLGSGGGIFSSNDSSFNDSASSIPPVPPMPDSFRDVRQLQTQSTPTSRRPSAEVLRQPKPTQRINELGVTLEGLLIRKHLQDHNEARARNRRWVKVWCVMAIDDERGVELAMFKVDPGPGDQEVNFDERELVDYCRPLGGSFPSPPDQYNVTGTDIPMKTDGGTPSKVLRISNQPPLVFNLLHSLTSAVKAPGYSPTRPFVLNMLINNGSSHLFQAPSAGALTEWTKTLNYWAARRSKEQMRGAVSSTEYGWNFVAAERRLMERDWDDNTHHQSSSTAPTSPTSTADSHKGDRFSSPTSNWNIGESRSSFGSLNDIGGSLAGIVGGGSGSGWNRKIKIEQWVPPAGTGMVISSLPEELQLESMKRLADALSNELAEHASYKAPMERQYALNPAAKAKAMGNWHRKHKYLTYEYDRYSCYVQVLRTAVSDREQRRLEESGIVFADSASSNKSLRQGASATGSSGNEGGGANVGGVRRRVRKASITTIDTVSSVEDVATLGAGYNRA